MTRTDRLESDDGARRRRERAQLVLVAAGLIAVALAPVVFAYLQLGYHADVEASTDYDDPVGNADRNLGRAVHDAGGDVPSRFGWPARTAAVSAVRSDLSPRLDALETSRLATGTAYQLDYNPSAAADWAAANCPGGPGRQFGACEADRGVVVQERAGQTHVLVVAFDVTVTTERGTHEVTLVVPVVE